MKMIFIAILTTLLVGCVDQTTQPVIPECEFQNTTSLSLVARDCGEGCFLVVTKYSPINKEDYPKNYTLPYTLILKTDNCGLKSLVYHKPTRTYITHLYDMEDNLLGAEISEEPCRTPAEIIGIKLTCFEITKEMVYEVLQEPERYLSYADCKIV